LTLPVNIMIASARAQMPASRTGKAKKAEHAEDDSEEAQTQLRNCDLSRVDVEAADAEQAEE
jgi:hypothetical protein